MKTKYWLEAAARCLGLLFCTFALTACATNQEVVMHSFGFDAFQDSPGIEILNYRYGNSKTTGARPPDWAIQENRVTQQFKMTGEILRGDELYVKWRIKVREMFTRTRSICAADFPKTSKALKFISSSRGISFLCT